MNTSDAAGCYATRDAAFWTVRWGRLQCLLVNRPTKIFSGGSSLLVAGAMSGTSADGVDVAVVQVDVQVDGAGPADRVSPADRILGARLLAHRQHPYDPDLRRRIFDLRGGGPVHLSVLAAVGRPITLAYAAVVRDALSAAGLDGSALAAVAAHGQTLYHDPPDTIQWLDPALLAAEVGCPVVSDFRRADCAAGGQGAPLVPFADYVLFRHPHKSRVLLNIGGIANLTYLPAGGSVDQVLAFDTGPGNCISDWLVRTHDPGGPGYDLGGELAARGQPVPVMRMTVSNDGDFAKRPPKSTDGPAMIELFRLAMNKTGGGHSINDLLKTSCLITVRGIAEAVRWFAPATPDELIVSGGGVHNHAMMELLREAFGTLPTLRTDELGVPGDAKEAGAFAILGAATLCGIPSNVPGATGARRPVVLGSITPEP